jgi:hypothetical protein
MSDNSPNRRFDGKLLTAPFGGENVARTERDGYRALLDEHDSEIITWEFRRNTDSYI